MDDVARKPFGFVVKREMGGWNVHLPHACDEWTIAWEVAAEPADYGGETFRTAAVVELRRFLTEGQAALDALERGEEWGVS